VWCVVRRDITLPEVHKTVQVLETEQHARNLQRRLTVQSGGGGVYYEVKEWLTALPEGEL
jgi:hypothetical protein